MAHRLLSRALASLALFWLGATGSAGAVVMVTDSDDFLPFVTLDRPTGQLDETGLSGFEFQISSLTGEFRANDQYLISGESTEEGAALGNDLGLVGDLSGVSFGFSIQHNLTGGRNFTFSLTNLLSSEVSVLCWGENCPSGSNATAILDGIPPISDYNGLQIQVRAQDVVGSSAAVTITGLTGVSLAGAGLFDETVMPDSVGTLPGDPGRRGQWMMADSLDLVLNEWELLGTVTLSRPDAALADRTKVRLAVDLVRDPNLPFLVPEPSSFVMLASCALVAGAVRRRTRGSAGPLGLG